MVRVDPQGGLQERPRLQGPLLDQVGVGEVVQQVGNTKIIKMNVKVRENNFNVTILDDNNGDDLTPEEYARKYPMD